MSYKINVIYVCFHCHAERRLVVFRNWKLTYIFEADSLGICAAIPYWSEPGTALLQICKVHYGSFMEECRNRAGISVATTNKKVETHRNRDSIQNKWATSQCQRRVTKLEHRLGKWIPRHKRRMCLDVHSKMRFCKHNTM